MGVQKFLARNHRFYVAGPAGTQTGPWTVISGISEWSWGEDSSDADSSDFDSSGWTSSFVVSRGATLGINGLYLVDEATGTKDAGQQEAEKAAHGFGANSLRWFKVEALKTDRSSAIGSIVVQGSVKMGESGGGMEDIQPFGIEVLVQGQPIGSGIYNIFIQA